MTRISQKASDSILILSIITIPMTQIIPTNQTATGSYLVASHTFEEHMKHYTPEQAETLRFWFYLGKQNSWSLKDLEKKSGASSTTITRLFRNLYEGDVDGQIAKLTKARENFAESAENPDFIPTSLSKVFFAACEKTRGLANVTLMWGAMGIGKTTIAEEYQRQNNHGKTILIRFPVGASFAYFVQCVAKATGVATRSQSQFHMREKIIATLAAGKRLVLVDELHQAFLTTRGDTAVRCCEFLRELKDLSGCGLVLIGTELLQKEFFSGIHKASLAQLVDRGTVQIPLKSKPTDSDVKKFLAHYDLAWPGPGDGAAASILNDVLQSSGLRKLTMHLRDGLAFANKRDEPYTWFHFTAAHDAIKSLSNR